MKRDIYYFAECIKSNFIKYFSENTLKHYVGNSFPRSSHKSEFAWLSHSGFRSSATLHTIVVPEDISRSSVRPSRASLSSTLSLYNPRAKFAELVRGISHTQLVARRISDARDAREARRGGMDAFKIRERESLPGKDGRRSRRKNGGREEKTRARAEDGSFEGAGRWSSS